MKNTENEYRIIVRNKQTIDSETDVIEEIAYGSFNEKNGKYYIMYKLDGEDKISSMIKADDTTVTIKRGGSAKSSMVYKSGEKHSFLYEVPFGRLQMETETHRVINNLDENGGTIELVYTLTVQGEKYFNDMKIIIVKR